MSPVTSRSSAPPTYRLLLVDANRGDRDRLRGQLAAISGVTLTIDEASTLYGAMKLLDEQPYDGLVLDLNLPDAHGLDALKSLRAASPETPIVVMTGEPAGGLPTDVLSAGAQDVLNKHPTGTDLMARAMLYSLERHRGEALRQQVERDLTHSPESVVVTDRHGVILFVNPAAATLLGQAPADLLGETFEFSRHHDRPLEIEITRGTQRRTAELRVVPCTWHARPAYLSTLRDATEQKRLTEQLRHSQKLEAVGQLAGGIAHDFNNILTVILASADLMLDEITAEHPSQRSIAEIQQAGRRAATLTHQLLTFARRQVYAPRVVDLNEVVTRIQKMLTRLIGAHVRNVLKLEATPSHVLIDPDGMGQVVTNLVLNARDAMPRGGTISIATSNVGLDSGGSAAWGLAPGRYVALSVRDTGEGMPPELRERVFEPFYTTKKEHGSGLGLSMVHGIVAQSGGAVRVDTELGVGTTFTILLPLAAEVGDRMPRPATPPNALSGTERILLVEDEPSVRAVTRRILVDAGYRVSAVESAVKALAVWQQAPGRFDLVLTDVVMADMNGWALGERILAHTPAQKILYMSGYSNEALAQHGTALSSFTMLKKPFTKPDLLEAVRSSLDRQV